MIVREFLTRLGFKSDLSGSKAFQDRMAQLRRDAVAAGTAVELTGRKASSALDRIRAHATSARQSMVEFGQSSAAAVTGIIGAVSLPLLAMGVKDYADAWTNSTNKLRAAAQATGIQTRSLSALKQEANAARTDLTAYTTLYTRLIQASEMLGASEQQVATVTQTVAMGLKAYGATAEEAASAAVQFAQGLQSGTLQGDELRSLLENAPALAKAIAQEFGVTVDKLRKMGEEGELSARRVFTAIYNSNSDVKAQFQSTTMTISDAMVQFRNNLQEYIGTTNEANGASQIVIRVINWFSENIGVLATGITVLLVPALMALVLWIGNTTAAFVAMGAALLLNPITWIVLAIAAAVAALVLAGNDLWVWMQGGDSIIGSFIGSWEDVKTTLSNFGQTYIQPIIDWWNNFKAALRDQDFGAAMELAFSGALETIKTLFIGLWQISLPGIIAQFAPNLFDPIKRIWAEVLASLQATWSSFLSTISNTAAGRALRTVGGWFTSDEPETPGDPTNPRGVIPGIGNPQGPVPLTRGLGPTGRTSTSTTTVNNNQRPTINVEVTPSGGIDADNAGAIGAEIGRQVQDALDQSYRDARRDFTNTAQ